MALTLAQSALLAQDRLYKGVIQTLYTESDLLKFLPFDMVDGNALAVNRENSNTGTDADWYDPGDTWAESTKTFSQVTFALKRLGGRVEIDNFAQLTRSAQNDQAAVQIALKMKDIAQKVDQAAITGDSATNAKQPDGLRVLCTTGNANRITMGTNGATLTLDKLDELIDTVKGKPAFLMMSKRSRRKLKALWRGTGSSYETAPEFGRDVMLYNGIPIVINEFILNTLTKGTSSDTSEIYAVNTDDGWGFRAIQGAASAPATAQVGPDTVRLPGPMVKDIGESETKDAKIYRVSWYPAFALFNLRAIACLDGVRD